MLWRCPMENQNARFVELLGQHERQLNAYVLALIPNWADADDIVQQTRIRLWEQFDSYDPSKDFGTWARVIAHYQVLAYRKNARRSSLQLSDQVLDKLADTEMVPSDTGTDRQSYLSECVDEMPEDDRSLLARCYSGEETIKNVAAELGRSFNNVRQTLFRMRQRLFDCVERKLAKEHRR
ncbi:MAG: sigma-70 family RNA polymerase sigma factor [Pirellulales bacterium]|nr:sigma-70 family RNA polymerase sigma factor [Pirellulales bacterium]